jgi:hypothetical protein
MEAEEIALLTRGSSALLIHSSYGSMVSQAAVQTPV